MALTGIADQPATATPRRGLLAVLERLASSRLFAYGTLLLLQLKVVWGIWLYRDLSEGDTANYFAYAVGWHNNFQVPIHWSPLYTSFYGTLINLSSDAYFVTTLHRLIIVFVAAILVLALMRRLIPHTAAWLIAAWWVVIPNTFDTIFEVHLFAVIPPLLAYLVVLYKPTIWTRGAALGIFVVSAFLNRNEFFIAVGMWALLCFGYEVYQARKRGAQPARTYLRAYGLPILLAMMLVVFFYWRSSSQFPALADGISRKLTLNQCQVYAYNYQQRFSDWMKNPFLYCQELMMRDFGVPEPSTFEAIRRNPRAMLDFFLWNVRLIPAGIQMVLFNATSDSFSPDYISRIIESRWPLRLSILALAVVGIGGWLILKNGWWELWIKSRIWGWLALLCVMVVMVFVMVTQRPRPSYLFNLFLFLTAIIGLCGAAIVDRVIGMKRFALLFPFVVAGLLIIVPPFYNSGMRSRIYLQHYQRLAPFDAQLAGRSTKVLSTSSANMICYYNQVRACQPIDYLTFIDNKPDDMLLADWLADADIAYFYVTEDIMAAPVVQEFLQNSSRDGWDTLANVHTETENWRLLERR